MKKTLKKVLVLGGTGFVGRHVCEKLVRLNINVTVPTRRSSNAQSIQLLPMLDVLEANIEAAGIAASALAVTSALTARSSNTASITRSAPASPE